MYWVIRVVLVLGGGLGGADVVVAAFRTRSKSGGRFVLVCPAREVTIAGCPALNDIVGRRQMWQMDVEAQS